jgi:hypothetical protein
MQVNSSALSQWSSSLTDFVFTLIWSSMPTALLYAAMGLVAAIVLMVWVGRKSLLRRRPRAWNVLAKVSYLAILLVTLFAFTAVGVVRHVQKETMSALEVSVTPLVRANTVLLREYLTLKMSAYAPGQPVSARELVDATLKDLYYRPTSDSLWERGKARIVNWTLRKLGGEVLTAVFQKIIVAKVETMAAGLKNQTQNEAAKVGVDALRKVLLDANRRVDLSALDRTLPQIILDVAGQQIHAVFVHAYLTIALIWLGIGALIGAEMLLYLRWYEKRQQPPPNLV